MIIYFNQKDFNKVIDIADNSILENNKLTDNLYDKASEAALYLDDLDKGIKFLKEAIKINDKKEYRKETD